MQSGAYKYMIVIGSLHVHLILLMEVSAAWSDADCLHLAGCYAMLCHTAPYLSLDAKSVW